MTISLKKISRSYLCTFIAMGTKKQSISLSLHPTQIHMEPYLEGNEHDQLISSRLPRQARVHGFHARSYLATKRGRQSRRVRVASQVVVSCHIKFSYAIFCFHIVRVNRGFKLSERRSRGRCLLKKINFYSKLEFRKRLHVFTVSYGTTLQLQHNVSKHL